jgi:hypothetical protein
LAAGLGVAILIFEDGSKAKENGKEGERNMKRGVGYAIYPIFISPK